MYKGIYITPFDPDHPMTQTKVYVWDDEKGLITQAWQDFNYAYRVSPTGTYTSIYGDTLARINKPPKDMPGLFESDVPRETRVLTDMYLHSDDPSTGHNILFFDIEVQADDGFPIPALANQPITAISTYWKEQDEFKVWLLDPEERVTNSVKGNVEIIGCRTERELIQGFLTYYSKTVQPTIISGWNSQGFDIPYMVNRFAKLDPAYIKKLSKIGLYKYSEHREAHTFAGVAHLDYMQVYKKFTYSQKPSYRLDAIAKEEVGVGKIEYTGTLDELYANDIDTFIEYSINDVRLLGMMDAKLKLIELVQFICHMGHVPYEDYAYSSRFIEGTILTYLHRQHIIAPNKPIVDTPAVYDANGPKGFDGAYVKPPVPGVYDWVYSLDLQSLYPSVIMSLNISPETIIGKIDSAWDVTAYSTGTLDKIVVTTQGNTQTFTCAEFRAWLQMNGYMVSSNGILYLSSKRGIIPQILESWFAKRKEYKDLMKKYVKEGDERMANFFDKRQHVQKIILNSCYGTLGLSSFRFYNLDNALAVTATGQDIIKTSAKFANKFYESRLKTARFITLEDNRKVVIYPADVLTISRDGATIQTTIDDLRTTDDLLMIGDTYM